MIATIAGPLKAPFPYFGGKSRAASLVWSRFGDVKNYVEPFAGSLAVLLGRPSPPQVETVNDLDGFIANAWRAIASDPEAVASWADWPVNEVDLTARHLWLVERREQLTGRLLADPDFFDAKIAGWWIWGACAWIGAGWCSGSGPWVRDGDTIVRRNAGQGINRQLPHLGNAGRGVNRKLPHLGDALLEYFLELSGRLRRVRVACGDWSRVVTPSVTHRHGLTGILLDPPYSAEDHRTMGLYAHDDATVAHRVREWALANGDNALLRIALCGYADQHDMPPGWTPAKWTARKGYQAGSRMARPTAETIWFSPHCLPAS